MFLTTVTGFIVLKYLWHTNLYSNYGKCLLQFTIMTYIFCSLVVLTINPGYSNTFKECNP